MKCLLMHQFGVPCLCSLDEPDQARIVTTDVKYFLRPGCIARVGPTEILISPYDQYPNAVYVDKDLFRLLLKGRFSALGMQQDIIDLLVKSGIISRSYNETVFKKIINVKTDALPFHALLEVTWRCQCQCLSCYCKDDIGDYNPPLTEIFQRIDFLAKLGICQIEITGGEPFMRSDIEQILEYIAAKQLNYCVITNGEFVTEISERSVDLLRSGLGLAISLDGFGVGHDLFRRRPGLFQKIRQSLYFAKLNHIETVLVTTLNRFNIDQVPAMINFASQYGFMIHLRPTHQVGAALDNIASEDLRAIVEPFLDHPYVINGFVGTVSRTLPAKYYGCRSRNRIVVSADGFIMPCPLNRNRKLLPLGELNQDSLSAMLSSDCEQLLLCHKKCIDCSLRKENSFICNGFCSLSNVYKKGVIW